jgi:hypothetical protein
MMTSAWSSAIFVREPAPSLRRVPMTHRKTAPRARSRRGLILAATMIMCACTSRSANRDAQPPAEEPAGARQAKGEPAGWSSKLGETVTVVGVAENLKLGARLEVDAGAIWIDGLDAWPDDLLGRRLVVTGRVIERHDLPVFVRKEGEPEIAGMPVPPGTDLHEASRRFLLAGARWQRTLD